MPSDNDGIMIILSSPSGAGKTTLVNLLSKLDDFEISISHTTRKPRHDEIPDKDYYFVTEDNFKRLINNSLLLTKLWSVKNAFLNVLNIAIPEHKNIG